MAKERICRGVMFAVLPKRTKLQLGNEYGYTSTVIQRFSSKKECRIMAEQFEDDGCHVMYMPLETARQIRGNTSLTMVGEEMNKNGLYVLED